MRAFLALLLLASVTLPVWAAEPEEPSRPEREARDGERFERPQRAERSERVFERVIRQQRERTSAEPASTEPPVERNRRAEGREGWPRTGQSPEREGVRRAIQERILRERGERSDRTAGTPPSLPPPAGGSVSSTGIGSVQPPLGANPLARSDRRVGETLRNRIATEGWRREWREDRRFDWRRHRDRDRSRFRLGIYVDPFGWGYRPWNVGWNMYPRFYSNRYWINDPWHYSLPPAYGPYRWVRYWDDALLVDLRTGRVVDVIRNFFW